MKAFPLFLSGVILLAASSPSLRSSPGDLKWAFQADSAVRSSPALGTNGLVYFGSMNGVFYALHSADGNLAWTQTNWSQQVSSPAVAPDGSVVVGAAGVLVLDGNTGKVRWFSSFGDVFSSPGIASDGTVFLTVGSYLYGVDLNQKKTTLTLPADGPTKYSSPVISKDGTIFSVQNQSLNAIHPRTGEILWSFTPGNSIESTPAIGADGTIYVTCYNKFIYALDPVTGETKWKYFAADSLSSSPALGPDGTLYAGANDGVLYALNTIDGREKWTFRTADTIHSSPAVAADGTVYFGSYDRSVYAVDGATGQQKWRFITGAQVLSSPLIGPDGTVYIGSQDGQLYAIEGSAPLAESLWPEFKGGPQRTSSVERDGPPALVHIPATFLVAEGSATSLGAVIQGTRPMTFQWFFEGRPVTPAAVTNSASLKIPAVSLANSGHYTLVASNALGTVTASTELQVGFTLSLTESRLGNLSVTPAKAVYLPGELVEITATPDEGRSFVSWAGNASGDTNRIRIVMNRHKQASAVYSTVPGEFRWEVAVEPGAPELFAVDDENTVFAAGITNLLALRGDTGAIKWRFNTNEEAITAAPVIGNDGSVLVGFSSQKLRALDPRTGRERWTFTGGAPAYSAPAVDADGTIYYQSQRGKTGLLSALEGPTGSVKWTASISNSAPYSSSPVVGGNGLVYVASECPRGVTALETGTGKIRWSVVMVVTNNLNCGASTMVLDEETLYFAPDSGVLVAYNAETGAERWRVTDQTSSAPAIGADNDLYAPDSTGNFAVLDRRTGAVLQNPSQPLNQPIFGPPLLGADGTIYALNATSQLVALNKDTFATIWAAPLSSFASPPQALGPDGNVYIWRWEDNQTLLTAYKGATPPADTPWPMPGQNAAHTNSRRQNSPRLSALQTTPGEVHLNARTKFGLANYLEYKNSLGSSAWSSLAVLPGDGFDHSITATNTSADHRFFRIRIE